LAETYHTPDRSVRECKYWWFDTWDWLINRGIGLAGAPEIRVGAGEIAIDPHVHTLYSHCSISTPDRLIRWAARIGLGGIGIMDHNDLRGVDCAIRCADELKLKKTIPEEFIIIPGVEVSSSKGHIGALFVREDIPESLDPAQTVRAIHEAGGLAIAVHPFHSTGVGEAVFDAPFDAVEIECGSVFDKQTVRLNSEMSTNARLADAAKLGASDAHYIRALGSCFTLLNVEEPSLEAARRAIIDRRATPVTSLPYRRLRRLLRAIPKLK
jgi:predicted metal-dependent phosphoesterase TrpH